MPAPEEFTANDTWNNPGGTDWTHLLVTVIAGGGGGGSGGARTNNSAGGGGGGGSGGRDTILIPKASLGATESVVVGAAGVGGAAKAPTGTGNAGTAGTTSSFGAHISVTGGGPGGGGLAAASGTNAGGAAGTAGSPNGTAGTAGGATSGNVALAVTDATGSAGGGGSGNAGSVPDVQDGGDGGDASEGSAQGGAGGTSGTPAGGNGDAGTSTQRGGGGGGSRRADNDGEPGGDGGSPGAGGGGGHGARASTTTLSGAGGDGAPGRVYVEYQNLADLTPATMSFSGVAMSDIPTAVITPATMAFSGVPHAGASAALTPGVITMEGDVLGTEGEISLNPDDAIITVTSGDIELSVDDPNPQLDPDPPGEGRQVWVRVLTPDSHLYVDVPPEDPTDPSQVTVLKRISPQYPAPTLDSRGHPVNWTPTTTTREDWGRLQVIVDNTDVTFYRDVPTIIGGWSIDEPFADRDATLIFPQVSVFETLPTWLGALKLVEIKVIRPDDSRVTLWEGVIGADENSISAKEGVLTVACVGSIWHLDYYIGRPSGKVDLPNDVGHSIWFWFGGELGIAPGLNCTMPTKVTTGIRHSVNGTWEPIVSGYFQEILAQAWTTDGTNQWTVSKEVGRKAVMELKDRTTEHWTVAAGSPGVDTDMSLDFAMGATVIYGEGVSQDGCRWRNMKYPLLRIDPPPVFPGGTITPGESGGYPLQQFEYVLVSKGYQVTADGFYDPDEEGIIRHFQYMNGLSVDGVIGPQTWIAAFDPAEQAGNLDGSRAYPIAYLEEAVPYFVREGGGGFVRNPAYDRSVPHIQRHINYGEAVNILEATQMARKEIGRNYPTNWAGQVTLDIDPEEGSRFEMRAGQNIRIKYWHGEEDGILAHIASVNVDPNSGTVQLDVDTAARDAMTLNSIRERDRNAHRPSWRRDRTYRNTRQIDDRPATWDCEAGSGKIPYHATYRGLWNCYPIPAARAGSVVYTRMQLDSPGEFAVGVFDREVSPAGMLTYGNPFDIDSFASEGSYWDQFGDGLLIAWGDEEQPAGYYPGLFSEDAPVTGVLQDNASWYFESFRAPWLWIAELVNTGPTINYIRGELRIALPY